MPVPVSVRRHWGAFRTPWVVRRLRRHKSPSVHRDQRLPDAFVYAGGPAEADTFAATLVAMTSGFTRPAPDDMPTHPAEERAEIDPLDLLDAPLPDFGTPSSGGGGGFDFFDADEFAVVILAIVAVLVILMIAVPLGLIAIELVFTLAVIATGVVARLTRIKPWTVLVLRNGTVAGAVSVKGWRTSRAMIGSLRHHLHG